MDLDYKVQIILDGEKVAETQYGAVSFASKAATHIADDAALEFVEECGRHESVIRNMDVRLVTPHDNYVRSCRVANDIYMDIVGNYVVFLVKQYRS